MCALVSRVHMMFYILKNGYTVSGNQGVHDKPDPKFLVKQNDNFKLPISYESGLYYSHIRVR